MKSYRFSINQKGRKKDDFGGCIAMDIALSGAKDLFFGVVRVEGGDGIAKGVAGEVGVDFGGGNAFVAQHLLHGAEVGSVFDQLGGEGVTQRVGTHMFLYTRLGDSLLEKHEDKVAREMAPATVEEDIFFLAGLDLDVGADIEDVGEHHVGIIDMINHAEEDIA